MGKASIIFADDNVLLRKFLKTTVQSDPTLCLINEAGDGLELLEQLKVATPDIILLDISMPNLSGLKAAEIIKNLYPQIKIVIMTMHQSQHFFHRASEIGVNGYILKEEIGDINHIISAVLRGKTYISAYFANRSHGPNLPNRVGSTISCKL